MTGSEGANGEYIYIWRYIVRPERLEEYLAAYGPEGAWVQLFKGAEGYRGTELLKDREQEDCYITIDRWDSLEDFNTFVSQNRDAFEALDRKCEGYTVAEERLGAFTDDLTP